MDILHDYLDDYYARNPEARERHQANIEAFFAGAYDAAAVTPIPSSECTESHRHPQGVNEDMAQCPKCWGITWAMRPYGESFGWHVDDCSLPMRHEGYCVPGGSGHVKPEGWKIRG